MNSPSGQHYNRTRTVFSICFLLLMAVMGMASFAAYVKKRLTPSTPPPAIRPDIPPVISFQEAYPFASPEETHIPSASPRKRITIFSAYWDLVRHLSHAIDGYSCKSNLLSPPLRSLPCRYNALIGNNVFENGNNPIFQIQNGYLTYIFPYVHSAESWSSIIDFSTWLKSRNIGYLMLLPAYKFDDSITSFPEYIPHGYSRMFKEYKRFLEENNIHYLDAKHELLPETKDFYSWFYKTDHHWNVHAGRLMAEKTARKLNNDFRIATDTDAIRPEKFSLTVYPNRFRGSLAVQPTIQAEDFEVFYQRQESCFHLEIPTLGIDRVGGFNNTLIARSFLYSVNPYCCFLYGDRPLIRIENKTCTNKTRILVLKTSNADVICPYLACAVKYLDIIDPRHFNGSIRSFIAATKPDAVMTCACIPGRGDEAFWKLK